MSGEYNGVRYASPVAAATVAPWRYVVNVDSGDRDVTADPSSNAYTIQLPRTYKNIVGARLMSLELPASFYTTSPDLSNDTVHVTVGATTHAVTVPAGSYDAAGLAAALQTALNSAFSGTATFTVSLGTYNLLATISATQAFTLDTETGAGAGSTNWGLGYNLGFSKGSLASDGLELTGTNPMNPNPYRYLYLEMEGFNWIDEGTRVSGRVNSAFAKIPITVNSFQFIFRDDDHARPQNEIRLRAPIARLDRIHVRWRFHDGTPVNFLGTEHSFSLELHCEESQFSATSSIMTVADTLRR